MGYWLEGLNGYLGDINTMALGYLRRRGPKVLREFVSNGGSKDQDEIDAVVEACKKSTDELVRSVGDMLKKAKAPVIITDGVNYEEEEAALRELQRRYRAARVVYKPKQTGVRRKRR